MSLLQVCYDEGVDAFQEEQEQEENEEDEEEETIADLVLGKLDEMRRVALSSSAHSGVPQHCEVHGWQVALQPVSRPMASPVPRVLPITRRALPSVL